MSGLVHSTQLKFPFHGMNADLEVLEESRDHNDMMENNVHRILLH